MSCKRLLLLLIVFPLHALAQCLTDYHINQMWRPHGLAADQVAAARALHPAVGWRYLARLGDPYAALAADVIEPEPGGAGQALHAYIHRHWVNTVGADATELNFESFARRHYQQYVEILGSGTWPDADQILNSYLAAARAHALPELIVFDAAWTASDYARVVSWQTLNHLPEERKVRRSRICLGITRFEANASLRRDFLQSASAAAHD